MCSSNKFDQSGNMFINIETGHKNIPKMIIFSGDAKPIVNIGRNLTLYIYVHWLYTLK